MSSWASRHRSSIGSGIDFGIELLGNVALDADRLDVPELFERRAEGEPVQEMDDRLIRDRLGAERQ